MNPTSENALTTSLTSIVSSAKNATKEEREELIQALIHGLNELDAATEVAVSRRWLHKGLRRCLNELDAAPEVATASISLSEEVKARFAFTRWRSETFQSLLLLDINSHSSQTLIWAYVEGKLFKLEALADLLPEEEDEPELRDHLVYWYIESRAEWFQYNCRINYSTVRGETPDPLMVAQASLCSKLIGSIEELFEEKQIELLADFISNPLPQCELLEELLSKVA